MMRESKMEKQKTICITGVGGQAGSVASTYLLNLGYRVIGLKRRTAGDTLQNVKHLLSNKNFEIYEGDITDPSSMNMYIEKYKPDYLLHYAAQSHVHSSFEQPSYTSNVNILGTLNILESIRWHHPYCRTYFSASSEMFGSNFNIVNGVKLQNEKTPFHARSPYGASKIAGFHLVQNYREAYGLFVVSGITFNFESPARGPNFLTRKVTKYVGQLYREMQKLSLIHESDKFALDVVGKLKLGNLDSFRDWSHCKDTVRAQFLMLQQVEPKDYVICSGETRSVRDFLKEAFGCIGIANYMSFVEIDKTLIRAAELDYLRGDCSLIKKELGWKPEIGFKELVKTMVEHDIKNF